MSEERKPGRWITGADIMREYGVLAVEIGEACFEGMLQAYDCSLSPFFESTKSDKALVWPSDVSDNSAYKIFSKIDNGGEPDKLEAFAIMKAAGGDTRFLHGCSTIAKMCYLPSNKRGLLFPFKWDDYFKETNAIILSLIKEHPDGDEKCNLANRLLDHDTLFGEYTEYISEMLFKRSEVDAWVNPHFAGQESPSANGEWAGMPADGKTEAEKQITAWTEEAGRRKGAEYKACLLTAAKWEGLNHIEAYDRINPGSPSQDGTKKTHLNRAKHAAQRIANASAGKLIMPDWRQGKPK